MSLPGVMGAFLAYIPITIFVTLVASLFISLTITPTLFYKASRRSATYFVNSEMEALLEPDAKLILEEERKGKERIAVSEGGWRERWLNAIVSWYDRSVSWILATAKRRVAIIVLPLFLF